jgi:carboxymethylenebutenolidase
MSAAAIIKEKVELAVADGTRMAGYVARPKQAAAHPGLLVFQEALGGNHHIRDVAERFAALGYVVIAPELFHRTAPPGFEASYADFPAVIEHYQAVAAEADVRSAYEWLRSNPRAKASEISCVGFCLGGLILFIANSTVPLRAAVSFDGGAIAPGLLDGASKFEAPSLLFVWGGLHRHITLEQRRAVIEALSAHQKIYVNTEFSRADHGFFCEPHSAGQARVLTLEFLRS